LVAAQSNSIEIPDHKTQKGSLFEKVFPLTSIVGEHSSSGRTRKWPGQGVRRFYSPSCFWPFLFFVKMVSHAVLPIVFCNRYQHSVAIHVDGISEHATPRERSETALVTKEPGEVEHNR
jgi:hypothetical protein